MKEYLKDKYGRIIGYIQRDGNKLVIYSHLGIRLGYYDGRYTYNIYGQIIGEGNFLVLFLKNKIQI